LQIKEGELPPPAILKELRRLFYSVNKYNVAQVYNRIEELNSSFHFKLKTKYPSLNENEIRLASLLLLGLNAKEISNILNIKPRSVDIKRYRLKKKLNLGSDTDLRAVLLSL